MPWLVEDFGLLWFLKLECLGAGGPWRSISSLSIPVCFLPIPSSTSSSSCWSLWGPCSFLVFPPFHSLGMSFLGGPLCFDKDHDMPAAIFFVVLIHGIATCLERINSPFCWKFQVISDAILMLSRKVVFFVLGALAFFSPVCHSCFGHVTFKPKPYL